MPTMPQVLFIAVSNTTELSGNFSLSDLVVSTALLYHDSWCFWQNRMVNISANLSPFMKVF
jgi:hypothetical protein